MHYNTDTQWPLAALHCDKRGATVMLMNTHEFNNTTEFVYPTQNETQIKLQSLMFGSDVTKTWAGFMTFKMW